MDSNGSSPTLTTFSDEYLREVRVGKHTVTVSIQGPEHETVPLLMCSGAGSDYRMWRQLRDRLQRTTITLNVQGPFLGRRPSVRTYATFLTAVLDELDYQRVDVLGHSWGAVAAQQLAHDHPERVRRLILAAATPGWISMPAKPVTVLALCTPQRDTDKLKKTIARLCAGDFLTDVDLPEKLGLLAPIDAPTFRRQILAVTGWSSLPWLRKVKHETLILHGSDDPLVPLINARLIAGLLPNASLRIITDGGHLFPYTRPDEIGLQLTAFLDGELSAKTSTQAGLNRAVGSAKGLVKRSGRVGARTGEVHSR